MHLQPYHSSPTLVLAAVSALVIGCAPSALSQTASRADSASHPVTDQSCTRKLASAAGDSLYVVANDSAMARMMKAMAAEPTGDVDRDFVTMMIPHHQGAIDMAVAFLRYGRNEQLRRLAQEIIVTQQQEIVAMRRAVGESRSSPIQPPTQPIFPESSGSKTASACKEPGL